MVIDIRKVFLVIFVVLIIAGSPGPVDAAELDDEHWPNIPAGYATETLKEYSTQTKLQVYFLPNLVRNVRTNKVAGNLNPRRALEEMLRGTVLTFEYVNKRAIGIVKRSEAEVPLDSSGAEILVESESSPGQAQYGDYRVTVRDIELSGVNSTADLLRMYTWDTGGGCYDDLVNITREARTNSTLGCGINLRGIGSGGTLLLINDRRVASSGTAALFGDISRIPLTAIETLQVTQDGAYTRYGGDAIGGVANFILRQEFQGVETRARWSPGTGGQVGERLFSQSMGTIRGSTSGLIAFEYYRRDALPAAARAQGTSDLTPRGGTNYGTPFGTPPNVAIGGQFPSPLKLFDRREGTDLIPSQTNMSALLRGTWDVSPLSRLHGSALVTWRQVTDRSAAQGAVLGLAHDNPNYLALDKSMKPETVYFGFLHSLGPSTLNNSVWNGDFDLTANSQFDNGWELESSMGYSFETQDEIVRGLFNPSTLGTAVETGAFNPFGSNDESVLQSISSRSQFLSTSALGRGSMTAQRAIPAGWLGEIKMVSGVEYRYESFDSREQAGSYAPDIRANRHRNVALAFGQVCIPFRTIGKDVCDEHHRRIAPRPQLTVGTRYEYYDGFGGHWAPAAQFLWSPVNPLIFKGAWSRSSKPPGLPDLIEEDNVSQIITVANPSAPSKVSSALLYSGGNPGLKRETAETWTATLSAEIIPRLITSLEYYDLDDHNRVDLPTITSDILTSPVSEELNLVTLNPTLSQREAVCTRSQYSGNSADCTQAPVDAVIDGRLHNVSRLRTRGVDFGISQQLDSSLVTAWEIGGTYILKYRISGPLGSANLVSSPGYPDQFRMRARVVLDRSNFETSLMAQYANGYHDFLDQPNRDVASWTTVDFHFKWKFRASRRELSNLNLSLDVRNLFNHYPPFVNSSAGVAFDSANASVYGRNVTVGVSKRW